MPITKTKDQAPSKTTTAQPSGGTPSRKPWKKKTPVQILLDQVDKLKEEIGQDEETLKQKKDQLKKFEEAAKLFEEK